ncbi:hypothetical protein FACS1894195_5570 [Bacteroidia bacterium]|nr:hypothetical protein FACS1894195_5570 [Bacteroidia bacterium]
MKLPAVAEITGFSGRWAATGWINHADTLEWDYPLDTLNTSFRIYRKAQNENVYKGFATITPLFAGGYSGNYYPVDAFKRGNKLVVVNQQLPYTPANRYYEYQVEAYNATSVSGRTDVHKGEKPQVANIGAVTATTDTFTAYESFNPASGQTSRQSHFYKVTLKIPVPADSVATAFRIYSKLDTLEANFADTLEWNFIAPSATNDSLTTQYRIYRKAKGTNTWEPTQYDYYWDGSSFQSDYAGGSWSATVAKVGTKVRVRVTRTIYSNNYNSATSKYDYSNRQGGNPNFYDYKVEAFNTVMMGVWPYSTNVYSAAYSADVVTEEPADL